MLVKSEARKNLPGFQILMFCNCVFFSQNDIECWEPGRVMYVTLPFSSWPFNFSFRRYLLAQHIQLKLKRTESRSTDVFKFCQYALVICSKLCVDPSTHKTSIWILLSAIHFSFVSFDNSVLIEPISFHVVDISFNTCLLDNNILIFWGENIFWSHMGSSRTEQGHLHPVDLLAL